MQIHRSNPNAERSSKWIITVNDDPKAFYARLSAIANMTNVRYICGQLEKEAHLHFQGYIQLFKVQRLSWMKSNISKTAHFEKQAARDNVQAQAYTRKQRTRVAPWKEFGEFAAGRGSRTDIVALYELAKSDLPLIRIAALMPKEYMKYYKAVQHVRHLPAMEVPWIRNDLKVTVLYGPPGTGKTHWAYEKDPNLYAIPVGKDLWWDNYIGQDTVLMDDFSGQARLVDLLRILDKYPVMVPVKGTFVYLHCIHIIITTNVPVEDWYDYSKRKDSEIALMRRIHTHYACRKEGNLYIREIIE